MSAEEDDRRNEGTEGLARGLSRLRRPVILVPPEVDEAVMREARKHLRRRAAARRSWFRPWHAAAALAGVLLVIQAWFSAGPRVAGREDVDRDGRIDVLDAMALARKLESGGAEAESFDLNGDGVVDRADVDWVAARAVRLDGGPRS